MKQEISAEIPMKTKDIRTVVEMKPCTYINGFSSDNSDVNFMLKNYDAYSDLVLFNDGKPNRCFRISDIPTAMAEMMQVIELCREALSNSDHIARIHNWPENQKIIRSALSAISKLMGE